MQDKPLRLPISLLTGFLGSGKTTLLNRWLAQPEMADTLVIINEFGAVGLDHLLVAHQADTPMVVELSNGCMCCQLRTDLKQTLKDVVWRFSRQGQRQFRRVVIETSGLADPVPILHTLMQDAYLATLYQLDTIAVVMDAELAETTLQTHVEARKQLALADVILIAKADLVAGATLGNVLQLLREFNPGARVYVLGEGENPGWLFAMGAIHLANFPVNHPAEVDGFPRWVQSLAQAQTLINAGGETNPHLRNTTTVSLELQQPLSRAQFEHWQAALQGYAEADLLRFKGIFHLQGEPVPLALHRVQHILHAPQALTGWQGQDNISRLVFILQDKATAAFNRLLQELPTQED